VTTSFRFESAGQTHVGRVRSINEDAWLARPEIGLWAVADGMGGHQRGDRASRMVIDALRALPPASDGRTLRQGVEAAVAEVNRTLRREAGPHQVSGTTVAVLLVRERHFAVLWAGDSRIYSLAAEGLACLTRDHSVVQELVDRGQLAPDHMNDHPLAHQITRAVGAEDDLVLDAAQGELWPGDRFLLCSDGLTKHLRDDAIRDLAGSVSAEVAVTRLIEAALAKGGTDNVTAVLAIVRDGEGETRPPSSG
jgi:serine/threonine protein phosphatase PrpC